MTTSDPQGLKFAAHLEKDLGLYKIYSKQENGRMPLSCYSRIPVERAIRRLERRVKELEDELHEARNR